MKTHEIITALEQTTSLNVKIDILQTNAENNVFKQVLKLAYDESVWGVKQLPVVQPNPDPKADTDQTLEKAIEVLYNLLVEKKVRGHNAREIISKVFAKVGPNNQKVLQKMITKDLKCGVNKKLIKKVFPNMFTEIGYMGAKPYSQKLIDKLITTENIIISQEKIDGEYANLVFNNGKIEMFSRSNKMYHLPEPFITRLQADLKGAPNLILNGELIIDGFDRYTSNGLLNRIFTYERKRLKGASDKTLAKVKDEIVKRSNMTIDELSTRIRYIIWDYIDTETPYLTRFARILKFFQQSQTIQIVPTIVFVKKDLSREKVDKLEEVFGRIETASVYDLPDQLLKHFKFIVHNGGEGTIVKGASKGWKDGKPDWQIKMKFEFECEMRIIGFKPGNPGTRFEQSLGALKCASECGTITCDPAGLTDELRDEIWNNQEKYKGAIVTVKANAISKDKYGNYGLLHPRFIKMREDKTKADSFLDIQAIVDGLLKTQ